MTVSVQQPIVLHQIHQQALFSKLEKLSDKLFKNNTNVQKYHWPYRLKSLADSLVHVLHPNEHELPKKLSKQIKNIKKTYHIIASILEHGKQSHSDIIADIVLNAFIFVLMQTRFDQQTGENSHFRSRTNSNSITCLNQARKLFIQNSSIHFR